VEVTPGGKSVWSWNGLAAFDRPPFADVEREGWMHVNSLTRLANGNTLISIRNFNTVVEVNKGGDVVWSITFRASVGKGFPATEGPIKGAANHEPEVLQNGNLLIALRRPHRFVELDRKTKSIVWQWQHPDGPRALKTNREANRLPNGNTLVSSQDRLYEVTRDGEIVWQVNAPPGGDNRRKFHKAIRIGPDGKAYGG
jgi:outer membrane protein assembly factor BamB